jgi:hypothetical protein
MATWKKLTKADGPVVHVNMDAVMSMQRVDSGTGQRTVLMFPVREYEMWVRETPDEICSLPEAILTRGLPDSVASCLAQTITSHLSTDLTDILDQRNRDYCIV